MNSLARKNIPATSMTVGLALALVGCSAHVSAHVGANQVSPDQLVKKVGAALTEQVGRAPDRVECPDSPPAKVGATVRCTLTDGASSSGVTVTADDVGDAVHLDIKVDPEALPGSDAS